MSTQVIAIVNQKGGVGKTTTAINLTSYLAQLGQSVLLVDLDPQANATSGLGIAHQTLSYSVYDAILGDKAMSDIVVATDIENLTLAPAKQELAGANIELVDVAQREYRLKSAIDSVKSFYDIIVIDSPPSLGLLTVNGLCASDYVLIPVQAEYYALEGLSQLLNTIYLVQENLNVDLKILGAVLTMYDKRLGLSSQVLMELYKHFPNKIFRSIIPRNVRLSEAPSHGKPICLYHPDSRGAKSYLKLAQEIRYLL